MSEKSEIEISRLLFKQQAQVHMTLPTITPMASGVIRTELCVVVQHRRDRSAIDGTKMAQNKP